MTGADQKIIFRAMGFMAVLLSDVPEDRQAERALAVATLIENFCVLHAKADKEAAAGTKRNDINSTMERMFASLINDNRKNKDLVRDALGLPEESIN